MLLHVFLYRCPVLQPLPRSYSTRFWGAAVDCCAMTPSALRHSDSRALQRTLSLLQASSKLHIKFPRTPVVFTGKKEKKYQIMRHDLESSRCCSWVLNMAALTPIHLHNLAKIETVNGVMNGKAQTKRVGKTWYLMLPLVGAVVLFINLLLLVPSPHRFGALPRANINDATSWCPVMVRG